MTREFLGLRGAGIGERATRNRSEADEDAVEAKRLTTWLATASFVARGIPYTLQKPPSRPVDLPGDHQIHSMLEKSRRKTRAGRKPTNAEFDVVSIFGSWLAEVLRCEESNRGTFMMVLRAIGTIEEVDPSDVRAREMREWLARVSGQELPEVVFWRDHRWLERASCLLARNENTMPTWLREGLRPPGFDPTAFAEEEGDDG